MRPQTSVRLGEVGGDFHLETPVFFVAKNGGGGVCFWRSTQELPRKKWSHSLIQKGSLLDVDGSDVCHVCQGLNSFFSI